MDLQGQSVRQLLAGMSPNGRVDRLAKRKGLLGRLARYARGRKTKKRKTL